MSGLLICAMLFVLVAFVLLIWVDIRQTFYDGEGALLPGLACLTLIAAALYIAWRAGGA